MSYDFKDCCISRMCGREAQLYIIHCVPRSLRDWSSSKVDTVFMSLPNEKISVAKHCVHNPSRKSGAI